MESGTSIKNWLNEYDKGKAVKSVEMGELGIQYEVVIQELAIGFMRELSEIEIPNNDLERLIVITKTSEKVYLTFKELEFTGNQIQSAENLAAMFWIYTPQKALGMLLEKKIPFKIQKANNTLKINYKN